MSSSNKISDMSELEYLKKRENVKQFYEVSKFLTFLSKVVSITGFIVFIILFIHGIATNDRNFMILSLWIVIILIILSALSGIAGIIIKRRGRNLEIELEVYDKQYRQSQESPIVKAAKELDLDTTGKTEGELKREIAKKMT